MERAFRKGQLVKVHRDNDNDSYDSFRGRKLKVVNYVKSSRECPAYDDSMGGMPLYSLMDVETRLPINCLLYLYELEPWN